MSGTALATNLKHTNDLGYYEMNAEKFTPMGDRILVQWEYHNDEITSGKIKLLKAEKFKKLKYTGIVLKIGPRVEADLQVGDRILFDQFSQFEQFFDPELGRLALLSERSQASAFAIIPARTKVGDGESDYNYEK